MQADPTVATKIKINEKLVPPPMYKIVYMNDDRTPVEFVVESLIEHFNYTVTTAEEVTMDIHNNGSAVVAVLPFELAEQKGIEITVSARSEGYPLQIKLEPQTE